MAIEDAAVIGNMFSFFSDKRQLTPMLRAYEVRRLAHFGWQDNHAGELGGTAYWWWYTTIQSCLLICL